MLELLVALLQMIFGVVCFWARRLKNWYRGKSPVQVLVDNLRAAQTFEEWETAAQDLDAHFSLDVWCRDPASEHYDHELISSRLESLERAREQNDLGQIVNLLRLGLVRNLGNITNPKLYNGAFAGTKRTVESYIRQVVSCIGVITGLPATGPGDPKPAQLTTQRKLDFIHDTRQAFGRTSLVLQGGAIFGLCHLGVVKALYLRGLLPRIITGTATGALVAALVGVHAEGDLPGILKGDGIDLSAFAGHTPGDEHQEQTILTRWATLKRRISRFWFEGHFLDVKVLEECVKANVGDMTFTEAYHRSGRILNITVTTESGKPTLLNYITAPCVLIRTAAVASLANSPSFYGRKTELLCKNMHGNIVPWTPADAPSSHHWAARADLENASPLRRVTQLFNVNHFIISQARPYLIPFLQSDMHGPSVLPNHSHFNQIKAFLIRMFGLEIRHRLRQLDKLGLLPVTVRRFLVDEEVPAASVMLVPEVSGGDFLRLLETPTKKTVDYWIHKGERSVWPAAAALRIRCAVELELERSYQSVRTLKALGMRRKTVPILKNAGMKNAGPTA